MPLIIVLGIMGSGKTLFLTIIGKHTKKKVVSNYGLKYPHEILDLKKLINAEYEDCVIFIDEAYTLLESRDSASNRNKLMSYILFQSRKKNIDLYLTAQLNSTLDLRYRALAEYRIMCERIEKGFRYLMLDFGKLVKKLMFLPIVKAEPYFKLFDTNEIIPPQIDIAEFMSDNEKVDTSKQLARKLFKKWGGQRITIAMVETFLIEEHESKVLTKLVYTYTKEKQHQAKKKKKVEKKERI